MKIILFIILFYFTNLILSASVLDHQKFCFPYPRARIVGASLANFAGSDLYATNADIYVNTAVSANVNYHLAGGTLFSGFSNTSLAIRSVWRILYNLEDLPCDQIITEVANSFVTIGKGVICFNVTLDSSFRVPITNCTLSFDANLGTNDDNFIMRGPQGRVMKYDSITWEWKNGASPCNLKWYTPSSHLNFLTISDNTTMYGDFISVAGTNQQILSSKSLSFYGSSFSTTGGFQNRKNMSMIRECPTPPWVECESQMYRHLSWGTNPMISDILYSTTQILNVPTSSYVVNNAINIHGSFVHKFQSLPNITQYNINGTTFVGSENDTVLNLFEQRKENFDIITKKTCDYDIITASSPQIIYNGTTCISTLSGITSVIFDAHGNSNALFFVIVSTWAIHANFSTQLVNESSSHNIHWVILENLSTSSTGYPMQIYIDGHINALNLTLSTSTTSSMPGILEMNRYVTINGSLHAKWSRYAAITNLNVYPSGLLLGDIEAPPPPNTICVETNGTCSDGFHFNVECNEGTFYSDQTCETYLFNRPNSSCVLADYTCLDGIRQNVTCDQEGATFYYDRTCAQYVPPIFIQSSCTLANGTCFNGLNVSCPLDGVYVENELCSEIEIIPQVDTYCLWPNGTCEQVLLGNVSCTGDGTYGYNATCPIIIVTPVRLSVGIISLIVVYGTLFSLGMIAILYFMFRHSQTFSSSSLNTFKKNDSLIFKKVHVV